MKIKFKCDGCGKVLVAQTGQAGNVSCCPKCGSPVKIPFPGLARLPYVGLQLLAWGVFLLFAFGMKACPEFLLVIMFTASIALAYQRLLNIGYPVGMSWAGSIPLSFLYFAVEKPGASQTRAKPGFIHYLLASLILFIGFLVCWVILLKSL